MEKPRELDPRAIKTAIAACEFVLENTGEYRPTDQTLGDFYLMRIEMRRVLNLLKDMDTYR